MQKVKISSKKHYIQFESAAEALSFRNREWLDRRAKMVAARAKARIERQNGNNVTRPSKMPRLPSPVAIDQNLRITYVVKHRDYERTGCLPGSGVRSFIQRKIP